MKPLFVWTISVGVLAAAAGLKWAATAQQQQGPIFIAGDRPPYLCTPTGRTKHSQFEAKLEYRARRRISEGGALSGA
jgi:hypothetical protein